MENIAAAFEKKKKCYLSPKMEGLINEQIGVEFTASQLYKSLACWCEYVGYTGTASFLGKHVDEERGHMNKLYEYSLDRQCNPITPATKAPIHSCSDLKDVLEKALAHEELVENTYKSAIKVAMSENDMTSFGLFQFFLKEQVEEIKIFAGLLDRLDIVGYDKKGMFFLDQEIGKI